MAAEEKSGSLAEITDINQNEQKVDAVPMHDGTADRPSTVPSDHPTFEETLGATGTCRSCSPDK